MQFRHKPKWLLNDVKKRYYATYSTGAAMPRTSPIAAIRDYHQSHNIGYFSDPQREIFGGHGNGMPMLQTGFIGTGFPATDNPNESGILADALQKPRLPDARADIDGSSIPDRSDTEGK
jgi:hypothetical protein